MKTYERIISIIMLTVISVSNVATPVAYAAPLGKFHFVFPKQSSVDPNTFTKVPNFSVGDHGSVLGASTTLFTVGTQNLDLRQSGGNGSAGKRIPIVVQKLDKKVYETTEDVALTVLNPDNEPFTTSVTDAQNQPINVPVTENNNGMTTTVDLAPSNQIKPGLYKVTITDTTNKSTEQDFTWGVLALNTDKSMYHPGEKADIAMAVLNNNGDMVCDAHVKLDIQDKYGNGPELSTDGTEDNKITVSDQCQKHDFSLEPDYEGQYTFPAAGTYTMTLTATTSGGTHTITDTIQVTDKIPFDLQRVSATRIYPLNTYPMLFNITANRDFNGTVTETVPDSFTITPATGSATQSYTDMTTVYLNSNDPAAVMSQQIASNSGGLVMPFHGSYPITQGFGAQLTDPTLQAFYTHYGLGGHDGIDFGVPMNTPLYAVDGGTVIWSGPGDYGTMVTIKHSWGQTYYGHMTNTSVAVGQQVEKGQLIGYSGMTGEATGPHLHFGMKPNNPDMENGYYGKIDPMPFLPIGQGEPITALGASANTVENLVYNTTVLGASDSAGTPTPTDAPSPTPTPTTDSVPLATASATPTPGLGSSIPTTAPTTSPTPSAPPSVLTPPAQTPDQSVFSQPTKADNTTFSVLDQNIKINEQIANSALTDKVKVLSWKVNLKKGQSTSLGYAYQAPRVSPQYYLLGPAKFYSGGDDRVVFQEDRQWQIASDDVGVDWYTNTTQHKWNGYSWQYRRKLDISHNLVSTGSLTSITATSSALFMEPGTDATQDFSLFGSTSTSGSSTITSDNSIYNTGGRSIKSTAVSGSGSNTTYAVSPAGSLAASKGRISLYVYFDTTQNNGDFIDLYNNTTWASGLELTTANKLSFLSVTGTTTLATGTWYHISIAYNVTSTTVNDTRVWLNGKLEIVSHNNSWSSATVDRFRIGSQLEGGTLAANQTVHFDDLYTDNSTILADPGDIHVTAKLPIADGASNVYAHNGSAGGTVCNSGGSNSGDCQYVNERPLNTTDYLSTSSTPTRENFTLQSASAGDVDISQATLIADAAWVYTTVGTASCTGKITNNGFDKSITITTSNAMFTDYSQIASTSAYPSSNQGVGIQSCSTNALKLYEAGMNIAYIPVGSALITNTTTPTFMESGSDATGDLSFYQGASGDSFNLSGVTSDTSIKNTGPRSIKMTDTAGANPGLAAPIGSVGKTSRVSLYVYFDNMVNTGVIDFTNLYNNLTFLGAPVTLGTSDKLQCADGTTVGTTTLTTGTWYRISFAYIYSSGAPAKLTTRVYLNGKLEINCGAQSEPGTDNLVPNYVLFGSDQTNQTVHIDDIYVDNGSDESDPGDIHVTAKLPIADGASNGYTHNGSAGGTACNSGGSNTGDCQYVNERPLNTTDFLSSTTASSRENFTMQSASQGDVDISSAGIIADQAWVYASSSNASCTGDLTNTGNDNPITLTTTNTLFTNYDTNANFLSGNYGVGIQNCTSGTGSLYEAGMNIAYTNNNPGNTLTNFPVLVSLTDTDLNNHAQSSGNDILFTDSTGRNLLNYEIENYSAGTLVAWVQIPTLSSSTDTIIYMYYGNPSTSSLAVSPWDSSYVGVWHLGPTVKSCTSSCTLATSDSTGNGNNGTNVGGTTTAAGEIGDAGSFAGTTQYITAATSNSLDYISNAITMSAWINPSSGSLSTSFNRVLSRGTQPNQNWIIAEDGSDVGHMYFGFGSSILIDYNSAFTAGKWYYITVTGSSSDMIAYLNGGVDNNTGSGVSSIATGGGMGIGADNDGTTPWVGSIDEVELSYIARTSGWIKTEYNNQDAPSTFIPTIGSVETDIYAPTLSALMRHGEFFNTQGQIQPFTF